MPKNAIDLLVADHKKVRQLLEELTETTARASKKRKKLLDQIATELTVHTQIEEKIFYPAFRKADGKEHEKIFYEAKEEHRAVDKLVLPDLKKTRPDSEKFSGRAKILKELIEHHADEEESEMFKEARKTISGEDLEKLGARMEEMKKKLKA